MKKCTRWSLFIVLVVLMCSISAFAYAAAYYLENDNYAITIDANNSEPDLTIRVVYAGYSYYRLGQNDLVWTSSDTNVVSIDSSSYTTCKLIAHNEGTAVVSYTARYGSNTGSCTVTVTKVYPTEVTINMTQANLRITRDNSNPTLQLSVTNEPANAVMDCTWTSSNNNVATVDNNGLVTAKGKGECVISCAVAGTEFVVTSNITVEKDELKSIKLNTTKKTLTRTSSNMNPTCQLQVVTNPSDAVLPSLKWTSSNKKIATVSANGLVTAVKAGTCKITCSVSGTNLKATAKITVEDRKAKSVKLNIAKKTLVLTNSNPNPTCKLTATVKPTDAVASELVWSSSNKKVATVDENGLVTAVGAGKCKITCKVKNTKVSATAVITVARYDVKSIKLNKSSLSLKIKPGDTNPTATLTAKITPSNASNKDVTWTTSNPAVATVNENGHVTAIGVGTATITCTSQDNANKKATCKVTVTKAEAKLTYNNPHIGTYYGYKRLFITFTNNTYDTIDRIDFRAEYFDVYGNRVYGYGYYRYDENWLEEVIRPGETAGGDHYWNMWGYDGASKVKITLLKYHTTSGKTVTLNR